MPTIHPKLREAFEKRFVSIDPEAVRTRAYPPFEEEILQFVAEREALAREEERAGFLTAFLNSAGVMYKEIIDLLTQTSNTDL